VLLAHTRAVSGYARTNVEAFHSPVTAGNTEVMGVKTMPALGPS